MSMPRVQDVDGPDDCNDDVQGVNQVKVAAGCWQVVDKDEDEDGPTNTGSGG